MSDEGELLFFDTFSHDSSEDLNLDLVQFPRPVYVHEIRIVPLGTRVQADFPGGHRLGATNPSTFQLEFFVNDLYQRGACTFEKIGSFEYKQNVDIQFMVTKKIPTDGLVLLGSYSTITLAVYGVLTKVSKERSSPPPPPPPPPQVTSKPPADIHQSSVGNPIPPAKADWEREPRTEVKREPSPPPPPSSPPPPVHHHRPPPIRYADPAPVPRVIPEKHPPSFPERGPSSYSEPGVKLYPRHHPPPPIHHGSSYGQYELGGRYSKPWSSQDDPYPSKPDSYERAPQYEAQESRNYPAHNPVLPWEQRVDSRGDELCRDSDKYRSRELEKDKVHHHDFGEDVMRGSGRDSKRRERDRDSSWERYGQDFLERYRERDRDKEHDWGAKDYRARDRDKDRIPRDRDRLRDPKSGGSRSPCDIGRERRDVHKRPPSPASPSRPQRPRTPPLERDKKPVKGRNDEAPERGDEQHPREAGKEDPFEPLTPERSPSEAFNISDGEIQEGENLDDDPYEEIISEEEDMSDIDERGLEMGEIEYEICDDAWSSMPSFNPFQCALLPLQHFSSPVSSEFEIVREKLLTAQHRQEELPEASQKLLQLLEQFVDKDHTEKWVEAVETIASSLVLTGLANIPSGVTFNSTVSTLVSWVKEALNFELAMQQPLTPYKVRHMKSGLRLAATLFQSHKDIVKILLDNSVPKLVLELYNKPYMSLPIKLLIVRTLDAATFTPEGINHILSVKFSVEDTTDLKKLENEDSFETEKKGVRWLTGYQYLIQIMMAKQSTRALVALSSLMKKIHLYEVLHELDEVIEKILQGTVEIRSPKGADADTDSDMSAAPVGGVTVNQIETAISCVNEIAHIYKNAYSIVAQPLRYLPVQCQFEVPQSPFNPYPGLFRMFQDSHLLESIFVLVSSPSTAAHCGILTSVRELMNEIIQSNAGVQFLTRNNDVMNGINRSLLQAVDENRDESGEDGIAHQLGLQLVFTLQAFQYIDTLFAYHSKAGTKKEIDESEAVTSLHQLYCMTFSLVGKSAVINLLAMDSNLECLLPFVEMTAGDEEYSTKLSKSVCCAYATELILLTVHHSESITLLQCFSQRLLSLSQQELTPKLQELAQWMLPTKKITNYSHESIVQLMANIKQCSEETTVLSPELITSLRMLHHIVLPPLSLKKGESELKYKYAIMHVFSNEGLSSFLLILQKLCDAFLKPSQQAVSLVGQQGVLVLAIIKPVVAIMQLILSELISCRGTEFKDLTAVPVLLRLHTLVSLYPMTWYMYSIAQQVQGNIVETFLAYTQPSLGLTESEEALTRSLWTQMVGEILKYSVISTGTYMTGFTLLSELLPLPLPLQTKEPLTADEVTKAVNTRKLWSAHLLPLSEGIRSIIIGIAATSCQPLQQLLRRVCVQLADLAPPTTIVVVRTILDALYEHIGTPTTPEEEKEPETKPCVSAAARILNFLSYMVSHATFKVAFLHIVKGSVKLDEKFSDVVSKLLALFNCTSSKSSHLHAQECIVSILQSLCDPDIGLVTIESGALVQDVLSNSLPHKELLMQITSTLLQHIGNSQHAFASVLPSVRTLVMLTEHDLGFLCLKSAMENHKTVLHSLFVRLASGFSKDSSDCLSTLSTSLELLRLMVQVYEDGPQLTRTLFLPAYELADLLSWSSPNKAKNEDASKEKSTDEKPLHPLLELEKLVVDCCSSEEEVLESLLENISGIITIFNEGLEAEKVTKEYRDVPLPQCESLASQFKARTVYVVGDIDEDRLSPSYWLGMPGVDDIEQEPEQVATDIVSILEKFCPDFDVKQALESLCLAGESTDDLDKKSSKRKYPPLTNPGSSEAPSKKPFIAPMRGRGFPRGSLHSSRANDPFRSRPPNTSRPPSMHVDDFLAMESHHPSTDNAANSKRSLKAGPPSHRIPSSYRGTFNDPMVFQDLSRGRGRGIDSSRGFGSSRGRFFSPPGPYSRHEASTRVSNNAPHPLSRSATIPMPNMWGMRSDQGNPIGAIKSPNSARLFPRSSITDRQPVSQRNRDPYTLILGGNIPMPGGERFGRSTRGGGSSALSGIPLGAIPLNWSDSRNKSQDGRFAVPSAPARGRPRDMVVRHTRSFTR